MNSGKKFQYTAVAVSAVLIILLMSFSALAETEKIQKGKALKKGDCIGITAPASFTEDNTFNQAVMFLQKLGYKVKIKRSCISKYRYFAGSDRRRAEDINELFEDDTVDAIMCLRGGYGCSRILEYLDYEMIAEHPKLLIGYSDITALHIALMERSGLATVHGPMVSSFNNIYSEYVKNLFLREIELDDLLEGREELTGEDIFELDRSSFEGTPMEYTVTQFLDGISTNKPIGEIAMPEKEELKTIIPGTASGKIIGGNLAVIASLAGTEYELRGDHDILFLEEVGESAYRIDRMLQQLYQNGLFDRVDGILIGEITGIDDEEAEICEEVIKEFARLAGKPCISGVPAGHGENNMFLPFGVRAKMTANKDGSASLKILEAALE